MAGFQRTATGEALGTVSFSSASCFLDSSASMEDGPVTFPVGCARLSTSRLPNGSPTPTMTMGIVPVACLAARDACVTDATMTSTFNPTSSAARSGRRSSFPSAHRGSIVTFRPTTQPSSRSPSRKDMRKFSSDVAEPGDSQPTRTTFAVCCALVARGKAAALPIIAMNSRRFIESPHSRVAAAVAGYRRRTQPFKVTTDTGPATRFRLGQCYSEPGARGLRPLRRTLLGCHK